jgi:hypothetical protein
MDSKGDTYIMKKLKIIVIIAIIITFFLTVRINTKGYIFSPPDIIDKEILDARIESQEAYWVENKSEMDSKRMVLDMINMMLSQQAMLEEAKKRGIEVTEEEVNRAIDEQIAMFEEMDIEEIGGGFAEMLEEEDLTIEEYFRKDYEIFKNNLYVQKLYEDIQEQEQNEPAKYDWGELMEQIQKDFREKHQKQINELKKEYGVDDIEADEDFFYF